MTLIESLLSQSKDGKRELARQHLIVDTTQKIWAVMDAADVSKADLAKILETSKSNVTQLLNGQRNMTLASLADICAALQVEPEVTLRDIRPSRRFDVFVQMEQMKVHGEVPESSIAASAQMMHTTHGRVTAGANVTVGMTKISNSVVA